MQVVTEKLELPPLTLQNPDGKRLMTVDIGTTTIAMQLYDMTGKVVDSFPECESPGQLWCRCALTDRGSKRIRKSGRYAEKVQ